MTVIEHVLARLRAIGVSDIFGVPGDYAFSVNDAIVKAPGMRWIGCCNELNAAYAADGYARVRGLGAVCTTYGVGELSAINGIAGSFAEHLPIFHLVGMPNMPTQEARSLTHHTLGNGEFNFFQRMTEPVVCASAIVTPQNVAHETERLIAKALYHRQPVYMAFPADLTNQQVVSQATPLDLPTSDKNSLESAVAAIANVLDKASTACILPGVLVARTGLKNALQSFVDASGLPFATMFMDKSVLDEQQVGYMGMYVGNLMEEGVRNFVESCDQVIKVGTLMTDFNTGAFTANLNPEKTISIEHHRVRIGAKTFSNVEMGDVLAALAKRISKHRTSTQVKPTSLSIPEGKNNEPITAAALYPRWQNFLQKDDILFAETGTVSMGLGFARLPKGAEFHNQTLWGSIGWATPAAFGAALAAPKRRLVLVTGEGSHQLTVQEITQFARFGLKPIIFVLNNSGYLIERLLCEDPKMEYNDVPAWRYTEIPHALGCDGWFTARVTTCGELDEVLQKLKRLDSAAYIEIVTDPYAASTLAVKLHENLKNLYQS